MTLLELFRQQRANRNYHASSDHQTVSNSSGLRLAGAAAAAIVPLLPPPLLALPRLHHRRALPATLQASLSQISLPRLGRQAMRIAFLDCEDAEKWCGHEEGVRRLLQAASFTAFKASRL